MNKGLNVFTSKAVGKLVSTPFPILVAIPAWTIMSVELCQDRIRRLTTGAEAAVRSDINRSEGSEAGDLPSVVLANRIVFL